jgi:hypothetical protein
LKQQVSPFWGKDIAQRGLACPTSPSNTNPCSSERVWANACTNARASEGGNVSSVGTTPPGSNHVDNVISLWKMVFHPTKL